MGRVPAVRVTLPPELRGVFFDFLWNTSKVWLRPTAPPVAPFADLAWHST